MTGRSIIMGAAVAALLTGGVGLRAQSNQERVAVDRCEQDLTYRMTAETGGRDPQNSLDFRGLDVRDQGRAVQVQGRGRFMRDRFDRGRDYTFQCAFNPRNGAATATYRWGGNFGGGYDEPGYQPPPSYRPPPGGDYGAGSRPSYPATGRVFFSGGIVNRASGRGLDVEGRSTRDSANVQQWDFGGNPNQMWDVIDQGSGTFSIISQGSGKALDVANHAATDGANVQQFRFSNGDNQLWRLERAGGGFYQIVSVSSGKCLDVNSAGINENGTNVQQWSCSGAPNQQWKLTPR